MLRTFFSAALAFVLVASLAFPAFSLSPSAESGPLTAPRNDAPSSIVPESEIFNFNGFPADKRLVTSDFGVLNLGELRYNGEPSRTLVYGAGDAEALSGNAKVIGLGGGAGPSQAMLGIAISDTPLPSNLGFSYSVDSPLQFDLEYPGDDRSLDEGRYSGTSIIGSDRVATKYNITGHGVNVAIVDTGTDFGNPDLQNSLARDENGIPIMLDADGQGIVLTQAQYVAKIDTYSGRILDAG